MKEFQGLGVVTVLDERHHWRWALRLSQPKRGPVLPALSLRMRM